MVAQMLEQREISPELQVLAAFYASERLMPAKAFAALIGVKPETESQMRARRQSPPFFKSGSAVFYRFEHVAEWLQKLRVEAERGGTGQRRAIKDILG
jgi:hypothetical protein